MNDDTVIKILKDAEKKCSDYWGCQDVSCENCSSKIDGKTPFDYCGVAGCSTAKCIDLVKRTALCVAKNTVSIPTYKDGEPVKLGDKVAIAGHAYKVRSLRVYPNDERTEVLVMREGSPIVGEEPFWTAFDKGLVKPYRSVDIRSISEDLHSFFSWCVEAEELSDDGVKRLLELVDEVDELAVEESKQRGAESNGNDSVKKN